MKNYSKEIIFGNTILGYFENVKDPRALDNQHYKFHHLLLMIICAIVCGANDIESIVHFVESKIDWFKSKLGVAKAPSYKTIWWLMVLMDPQMLNASFTNFIADIRIALGCEEVNRQEKEVIAIDGKTSRGTKRAHVKALHTVSAWSSTCQLLLGQVRTEEKSNEITAIPDLLDLLDLRNTVITIDAMGCQTAIAQKIVDGGGDYTLALKGNQETIHEEVKKVFEEDSSKASKNKDIKPIEFDMTSNEEKGHGRIEKRTVRVCHDIEWLKKEKKWANINSIIEIISEREIKGKITKEKRYYISSIKGGAKDFLKWIRSHWGVESLHWSLDVSFKEDLFQGFTGHLAENMTLLQRLTLMLLKKNPLKKSIAKKRDRAGWNTNYLLEILEM